MGEQYWKILSCNKGNLQLIVKLIVDEELSSYKLIISNLVDTWQEVREAEEIKTACKVFNRRLEAPVQSIIHHLHNSLDHHAPNNFECDIDGNGQSLKIVLKNSFSGGIPFTWEFACSRINDCMTVPLLRLVAALQHSQMELMNVIKKKDDEIRDYKDNGSKVTRPYLETEQFDSIKFHEKLRDNSVFCSVITKEPLALACDISINKLLSEVESDLKSSRVTENANSKHDASKLKEKASIKGEPTTVQKRGRRKGKHQPVGAKIHSDSEEEVNLNDSKTQSPSGTERHNESLKYMNTKKQNTVKRKKNKLF